VKWQGNLNSPVLKILQTPDRILRQCCTPYIIHTMKNEKINITEGVKYLWQVLIQNKPFTNDRDMCSPVKLIVNKLSTFEYSDVFYQCTLLEDFGLNHKTLDFATFNCILLDDNHSESSFKSSLNCHCTSELSTPAQIKAAPSVILQNNLWWHVIHVN